MRGTVKVQVPISTLRPFIYFVLSQLFTCTSDCLHSAAVYFSKALGQGFRSPEPSSDSSLSHGVPRHSGRSERKNELMNNIRSMCSLTYGEHDFNMVAERAIPIPAGRNRFDRSRQNEGSEQPPQKFSRILRNDPRDIQNKFNNKFQDAVGAAPSESSQLGPKKAQVESTSPKTFPTPIRPETGSGQDSD